MKYFRAEYEEHVVNKRCPTKQCKALQTPEVLPDKCRGCHACVKACPTGAITGTIKNPHSIDDKICIKCGACAQVCRFNAIIGVK